MSYDINEIIDDLGISGVVILFNDDDRNSCGYDNSNGFIFLDINCLSVTIVAHELRHFWQWQTGISRTEESLIGTFIIWDDKEAFLASMIHRFDHSEVPWEIDAIEYENHWRRHYSIPQRPINEAV